jgi:hypothetical protein
MATLDGALDAVGATLEGNGLVMRAVEGLEAAGRLVLLLAIRLPGIERALPKAEAEPAGAGGPAQRKLAFLLEGAFPGCTRGALVPGA